MNRNGRPGGLARARSCNMRELARSGGHAVHAKRGTEHMRSIGRAGARTFWRRYSMKPAGQSGWVILRRDDGSVVNFIGRLPMGRQ